MRRYDFNHKYKIFLTKINGVSDMEIRCLFLPSNVPQIKKAKYCSLRTGKFSLCFASHFQLYTHAHFQDLIKCYAPIYLNPSVLIVWLACVLHFAHVTTCWRIPIPWLSAQLVNGSRWKYTGSIADAQTQGAALLQPRNKFWNSPFRKATLFLSGLFQNFCFHTS